MDEDPPVESEDSQLYCYESKIIEMAEDEIAFAYHHLVILRYVDDMPSHTVWRTCHCQVPLRAGLELEQLTIA